MIDTDAMNHEELAGAIIAEVDRLWGEVPGFDATSQQYEWLEENYGITEAEDVVERRAKALKATSVF